MSISVGEVIFHGFEKAIKGQGLPNAKEEGKRGDLKITFLVNFPKELSEEERSMACEVLKDCSLGIKAYNNVWVFMSFTSCFFLYILCIYS
uniref:DnaJ-like protein dnj-20 n=1 Tax=Noccaea caerulescens TaxID=107243 RepID=A0A1J3I1E9_NOCCA